MWLNISQIATKSRKVISTPPTVIVQNETGYAIAARIHSSAMSQYERIASVAGDRACRDSTTLDHHLAGRGTQHERADAQEDDRPQHLQPDRGEHVEPGVAAQPDVGRGLDVGG